MMIAWWGAGRDESCPYKDVVWTGMSAVGDAATTDHGVSNERERAVETAPGMVGTPGEAGG
jgi:hypothetical protein